MPTPLGRVLSAFLSRFFSQYVDARFTSRMEERLDDVSGDRRHRVTHARPHDARRGPPAWGRRLL